MFKTKNPLMKNIQIIAEAMEWEDQPYLFTGSGNFFTWENKTEEDVEEIFKRTGIQCKLSGSGTLLVPEYDKFKSEKEKKLLMDLDQYGNVMMYLDLCKKSDVKDVRVMCKELFGILNQKCSSEELHEIIEKIINKIS